MGAGFRSVAAALVAVAAGVGTLATSTVAWGQQPAGETGGALPGFVRVGAAGPLDTGLVLSGLAGYGYQSAVVADSDRHHRAAVDLATSFRPLAWLGLAARFSGRYDRHTGSSSVDDSGWVGDPRMAARASAPVGGGVWVAAQAGLWIPGGDGPSLQPDAATFDLVGLASWTAPGGRFAFGVQTGFRFDRSAESIDRPEELSPSDRMALGVSESDAVLVGAGVALRTGATEWIGEWSWDALVGDRAPDGRDQPMRVGAGVRRQLTDTVGLQLLLEYSLARSPEPQAMDALFPIEPRFQALVGITLQPGRGKQRGLVATARAPGGDGATAEGPWIGVTVVDARGSPLAGADVVVLPGSGSSEVRMGHTDRRGRASFDGLEVGMARIQVSHRGHRSTSRLVDIEPGTRVTVDVALAQALPPGQLRGLVRSWSGRPLAAELEVSPLGKRTRADARGEFELNLPPGEYEVSIRADGYRAQRRHIRIEQHGVTILNVDLGR